MNGTALTYSTFLGSAGSEFSLGIAVDATGAAYVAGATSSTDFPMRSPYQPALNGPQDAFVAKLVPDGSGLEVLKRVRQAQPRLPVLILSMHTPDQFARRSLAAGASGYLTKDTADAELVTAVERLLKGGKYFGPQVLERLALGLHPDVDQQPHELLSDREDQVLRMIGSGQTVSEIAAVLGLSVKTVSTYRARVLEKMGMRTNAELTHYAVRNGLVE